MDGGYMGNIYFLVLTLLENYTYIRWLHIRCLVIILYLSTWSMIPSSRMIQKTKISGWLTQQSSSLQVVKYEDLFQVNLNGDKKFVGDGSYVETVHLMWVDPYIYYEDITPPPPQIVIILMQILLTEIHLLHPTRIYEAHSYLLHQKLPQWTKSTMECTQHKIFSQQLMSSFFSDFAGNSCARKHNKAKSKQEKKWAYSIFPGFGIAYARMNRSGVILILSFILSLFYFLIIFSNSPFSLCLHQSTPSPTVRPAPPRPPPLVWSGMRKHMTTSPPYLWTRLIQQWWCTPTLPTSTPTNAPPETYLSLRQWVESTMYFTIYYYDLFTLLPTLSPWSLNGFFIYMVIIYTTRIVERGFLETQKAKVIEMFKIINILMWWFSITKCGIEDWNGGFGITTCLIYIL